jgi:hypothetical protein
VTRSVFAVTTRCNQVDRHRCLVVSRQSVLAQRLTWAIMWITKSASVFLALISPWQTGGPPSRHVGLLGASTNVSTYLEFLRRRWEIKGVSIAVVQSPEFTSDGKWFRETEALGVRNDKGDRMKTDVSAGGVFGLHFDTSPFDGHCNHHRLSSVSRQTPSCLPLYQLDCSCSTKAFNLG